MPYALRPSARFIFALCACALFACKSSHDHPASTDAGSDASTHPATDAGNSHADSSVDSGQRVDASMSTEHDAGGGDDAGSAPSCVLTHVWMFGTGGGFIQTQTVAELNKAGVLKISRTGGPTDTMCMPPIAACGTAGKIDVSDIIKDAADPDVVAALAETDPPSFGMPTPDTGRFHIARDDGKSLDVFGGECDGSDAGGCTPTPAGVAKFRDDLAALEDAGLNDPACASL